MGVKLIYLLSIIACICYGLLTTGFVYIGAVEGTDDLRVDEYLEGPDPVISRAHHILGDLRAHRVDIQRVAWGEGPRAGAKFTPIL